MVELARPLEINTLRQLEVDCKSTCHVLQTGGYAEHIRSGAERRSAPDEAPNEVDSEPMDLSRHVWETKYRSAGPGATETTIMDTWRRVARALAAVEPTDPLCWEGRFYRILQGYKFLPGGRIQAGAGTDHDVTLFNCFVMGAVEDSIPGIFRALQEAAGRIYDLAYDLQLKGCTTFRPNPVTGMVLSEDNAGVEARHCCRAGARGGLMRGGYG